MISENRLYRRPASRPVGVPLPPNAADVAAGLVAEWVDMPSGGNEAFVEGHTLEVGATGWAVYRGRRGATVASGNHNMPKRAAVLALATHLVAEREGAAPIKGPIVVGQCIPGFGKVLAADGVTVTTEKTPMSPSPSWVPKVGDRVRYCGAITGGVGKTFVVKGVDRDYVEGVGDDGQSWATFLDSVEPIPAEKPGLPSFESLVWGPSACCQQAVCGDGMLRADPGFWHVFQPEALCATVSSPVGVHFGSLDAAKRAAYDAWVALQK